MKKRILTFMFAALLCMLLAANCFAEGARCTDNAGLLYDSEREEVSAKLDDVSEKHNMDVLVLTTRSTYGKGIVEYSDDYYDQSDWGQGTGRDGIILVISMEERDWYISTCGQAINAVTDYGISYIGNEMISELSEGDYAEAFESYAEACDKVLTQAENGAPYDVNNKVEEEELEEDHGFNPLGGLLSLLMGVLTALFPTLSMKNDLKSVNNQLKASNYIKDGSLKLAQKSDAFMYRHVATVPIVSDDSHGGSSTHMSSGGMSHGGGGGKF